MTPEDMATFRDYAKSEIVRLMKQRLTDFEDVQVHILRSISPDKLHFMQGILHGLNAAKNLTDPAWGYDVPQDYEKKSEEKAKPLVSAKQRAEASAKAK